MNHRFIATAQKLKPALVKTRVEPVYPEYGVDLSEGGTAVFDFGTHRVGFVKIRFESAGSIPDAPALVRFKFCETMRELDENSSDYRGWIGKGWLQEEILHIDTLPRTLSLPRRYAFRYLKIEVLAVSQKYRLRIARVSATAVTSAVGDVAVFGKTLREQQIDKISLHTLSECMQTEFEDGPKRDRRLWLGDLRLQALANYGTFQNNDLVKRCLYLFAGTANLIGQVSACVFTHPRIQADDTCLYDYSLLFVPTLLEFYQHTGDIGTLAELYDTAKRQIEVSQSKFDPYALIIDSDALGWCLLDWTLDLNRQAGAQAVYIYCAKALREIQHILKLDTTVTEKDILAKTTAAIESFYDPTIGLFVSGAERQVSYASNLWMVLAGVFPAEKNKELITRLRASEALKPVTPYLYHYYVQALLNAGMKAEAYDTMMHYWGGMADDGADCFYELFNPDNADESPYGSRMINSYCHAWSCTPSYFLRKYFS